MELTYLPIRALGDFVITASVVKDNFERRIPILLPDYLTDIFRTMGCDQYFDVVGTAPFSNQPAFFELYKVKDYKNAKRLLTDLQILRQSINKRQRYLLDYSSRRISMFNSNFVWPLPHENVYEGKQRLLAADKLIAADGSGHVIKPLQAGSTPKVLLLPDSRIATKEINKGLITAITGRFSDIDIHVGAFAKDAAAGEYAYSNFNQLIDLISAHDLVISAESLPYHLANYLQKPHYVIYNQSRHFKSTFMTPFMMAHNYYSTFTGDNGPVLHSLAKVFQA